MTWTQSANDCISLIIKLMIDHPTVFKEDLWIYKPCEKPFNYKRRHKKEKYDIFS